MRSICAMRHGLMPRKDPRCEYGRRKAFLFVSLCALFGIVAMFTSAPVTSAHPQPARGATLNYVPCSSLGSPFVVQSKSASVGSRGIAYAELWEVPDAVTDAPCRWYAHAIESGGPSGTLAAYLLDTGNLGSCGNLATAASVSSNGTSNVYTSHVNATTPVRAQTELNGNILTQTACVS